MTIKSDWRWVAENIRNSTVDEIVEFCRRNYPVATVERTVNTSGTPMIRLDHGGVILNITITKART